MKNLKRIFSETCRTIQQFSMRIDFEVMIFNFGAIMAMRRIKFCHKHQSHAHPFFKYEFFLEIWLCWGQNLSSFLSLPWILRNPYCHTAIINGLQITEQIKWLGDISPSVFLRMVPLRIIKILRQSLPLEINEICLIRICITKCPSSVGICNVFLSFSPIHNLWFHGKSENHVINVYHTLQIFYL